MNALQSKIKEVEDTAWEEAKGYVEDGDMKSLEEQVRNETKIMTELAYDVSKEQKKNKRLLIGLGITSALGALAGYLLFRNHKKSSVQQVSTKRDFPLYEIYKDGISAFIDERNGHLISTIEVTNPEDYKALSDEAYEYFKDTLAMLSAGND